MFIPGDGAEHTDAGLTVCATNGGKHKDKLRVVTGISFGFIFYVLDQIFGPLTLVYGIPPIIGALLPSASFFLISLWLMMRKA